MDLPGASSAGRRPGRVRGPVRDRNGEHDPAREADLHQIIGKARENRLGVLLFAGNPSAGLGLEKSINLWLTDRSPDWQIRMELGNLDVCILIAYLLKRNWRGNLNLITVMRDPSQVEGGKAFLARLVELARIPKDTNLHATHGEFPGYASQSPPADLNIFGMPGVLDFDAVRGLVEKTRSTCIFLLAAGEESALA